MNNQRLQFIEAIQAEPDDDFPRLIYADWLEDQGDPHGELIRVQCELGERANFSNAIIFESSDADRRASKPHRLHKDEPLDVLKQRETESLSQFQPVWVQPLQSLGARGIYLRRGFVDEIRIMAEEFVERSSKILELAPALRVLNLRKAKEFVGEVLATPEISRIRCLNLRLANLPDAAIRFLADCDALTQLTALDLQGNSIKPKGWNSLTTSTTLRSLSSLNLAATSLTAKRLGTLLNSTIASNATELILWGNSIGTVGLRHLAKWPSLKKLAVLDLRQCCTNESAFIRLIESPHWNPDCQLIVSPPLTDSSRIAEMGARIDFRYA